VLWFNPGAGGAAYPTPGGAPGRGGTPGPGGRFGPGGVLALGGKPGPGAGFRWGGRPWPGGYPKAVGAEAALGIPGAIALLESIGGRETGGNCGCPAGWYRAGDEGCWAAMVEGKLLFPRPAILAEETKFEGGWPRGGAQLLEPLAWGKLGRKGPPLGDGVDSGTGDPGGGVPKLLSATNNTCPWVQKFSNIETLQYLQLHYTDMW